MQTAPPPATIGPPLSWDQLPGALPQIAVGAVGGAAVRWGILDALGDTRLVEVTMAVNVAGAAVLGVLLGLGSPRRHRQIRPGWFLLLGTGFAASLTSLPAYALQVARALDDGNLALAATVGPTTPLAAVVAAGLGYRLGRWR